MGTGALYYDASYLCATVDAIPVCYFFHDDRGRGRCTSTAAAPSTDVYTTVMGSIRCCPTPTTGTTRHSK